MFRRKGDKSRSHARIFIGYRLQHVFKGKQPPGFLFKLQLGQLCVKVGFNGARFIERQRHAKFFSDAFN